MFAAVHADRSGRIVLAADYRAAAFDGVATKELSMAIPMPAGGEVVPLIDRIAIAIDRAGHVRELGPGRFAVAAVLPVGYVRALHPAYAETPSGADPPARPYTAVAADESGLLSVAGISIDADGATDRRADPSAAARINERLRRWPSNRVVRQLARCAREYRCRAATNVFFGVADAALPIAAPSNEHPPSAVSLHGADAAPTERARFIPSAEEIAEVAIAHLTDGGSLVAFGRACEGEPLLAARMLEPAIAAIRQRTSAGTLHLETNGSVPAAVARLARAGLDSIAVRVASARSETYERLHGPEGYRLTEVRASIEEATAAKLHVALLVLVLPGLSDQERELDAIIALAGELPAGSDILLRDLGADPRAAMRIVPRADAPMGLDRLIERIRAELPDLRVASIARPLARA